ncbi:saccharopine dehydrogenase family protein [Natronincola ferrireducens]|uniref:Saccharopine dehydrogenase, NADP-dependent n=1 Tax=Natronincola ferrireducens TaxID=393762 RepID=A0A1G8YMQ1_9FIRM|nr:saccharopine dehydrogenase C-terminal domain-containing protein [Natronincola ferrireducens]SDK03724.1 Saccharopine dehydrogenase, NADP-dependent [Natronincola ferrireducens]
MKILLIGTGGVGEAIAKITKKYDPNAEWMTKMVLANLNIEKANELASKLNDAERYPVEYLDATNKEAIKSLAKKYDIDVIMNCCDPTLNESIFDAALECDCNYVDMAMTLSIQHPTDPYNQSYIKLGDYQFAKGEEWKNKGKLALVGSGADPGMSDVFARYAEKHLFDEIEEIGVRDGGNLETEGHSVSFGFSIWTTIEECLNPPLIWEREKGWYAVEPFFEPEIFHFPEGIGDVEIVNVEHEEVSLIPRYIDKGLKKVTFKYGLGRDFIQALKYLQALNLDRKDIEIEVGGEKISPRSFVAKAAPNPATLGEKMTGKTCVGTWIKGKKDGLERQVYLYQATDNQEVMKRIGSQAVVTQTAYPTVIMLELLAKGIWSGAGVESPEAFDPDPFVERMEAYDFIGGLMEMESEYLQTIERDKIKEPLLKVVTAE